MDIGVARAEAQDGGAAKAMSPDLSAFVAHGGKLITYHGTTDGLIPYGNSVNYYKSVVAGGGDRIKENVALYLVPGMDHCTGGEGAFDVDWLAALEQWDRTGQKPSALDARHPALMSGSPFAPPTPSKPFARPVCAYPQTAKYEGAGDGADAANWECVAR